VNQFCCLAQKQIELSTEKENLQKFDKLNHNAQKILYSTLKPSFATIYQDISSHSQYKITKCQDLDN